jgi:tripartite-type tricarboxylate transporter receptor subunit TctC
MRSAKTRRTDGTSYHWTGFRRPVPGGRKLSRAVAASGALALALAATACANSGSSSSGAAAGSGGADTAYFAGKTITWIIPQAPGGSFYSSAEIVAPLVGKYLHATVHLESIPTAATITGQNETAAASPDGLTIGTLSIGDDVSNSIQGLPGVNFDLSKAVLIAGEPISPAGFVASTSSPYRTWNEVVNSGSPIKSLALTGEPQENTEIIFGAAGVKGDVLTGYTDSGLQVAGLLRGDGPLAYNSIAIFSGAISGGKARVLLLTGGVPKTSAYYNQLKDVPTIETYFSAHPPKTASAKAAVSALETEFAATSPNQVVFAPPGTPAARALALTDAFKAALTSASAERAFAKATLTPGFISPASSKSVMDKALSAAGELKTFLRAQSG